MNEEAANRLLEKLRSDLEVKLNWGSCSGWTKYDFEKIAELIFEDTKISLSASTLMRFFGKVDYKSSPSLTTLNTLSRFAGYEDWREYQRGAKLEEKIPVKKRRWEKVGLVCVVLIVGICFYAWKSVGDQAYRAEDFLFSSRKTLTIGVPNSVIFDYDASHAAEGDSIFISQNWDTSRKVKVDRNGKHHSAIYYYPGFFKAKLMVNNQIVKEHNLLIKTKGWFGLLERPYGEAPVYLKEKDFLLGNSISVKKVTLQNYGYVQAERINLYNYRDFGGVYSDNFQFTASIKSDNHSPQSPCRQFQFVIQSEEDVLIVPVVQKGCEGDTEIYAFGKTLESKFTDLSSLGTDLTKEAKVKISAEKGFIHIYINGRQAIEIKEISNTSKLMGIQIRAVGAFTCNDMSLNSVRL